MHKIVLSYIMSFFLLLFAVNVKEQAEKKYFDNSDFLKAEDIIKE